ncbi:TetR/AcrR family transcriptional regulator [Tepidibacter sp. Z1-5]|uniref:TetR/AcrR family transcriptional regulator n=1 Tax=Tepidibacter sp. Z1-5 TaxID=3134138 RepID=UPI0030C0621C
MNEDAKQKIATAANELFRTQGYNKTTIKQIVEATGMQVGSIYHFFKNKEEIFSYTAISTFETYREMVEDFYKDKGLSNAYYYAVTTFCTFYLAEHYDNCLDIIYEAFHAPLIMHTIARHTARTNMNWFKEYNPNCDFDSFYPKTLAMDGIIYSYLCNRVNCLDIPFRIRMKTYFDIALSTYNVPKHIISEIISDSCIDQMEFDVKELLNIYGTRIFERKTSQK